MAVHIGEIIFSKNLELLSIIMIFFTLKKPRDTTLASIWGSIFVSFFFLFRMYYFGNNVDYLCMDYYFFLT